MNREHIPDGHVLTPNFKPTDTTVSGEPMAMHENISGSCENISEFRISGFENHCDPARQMSVKFPWFIFTFKIKFRQHRTDL